MQYWTEYDMDRLIPQPVRDRIRLYDDNIYTLDVETTSIFMVGSSSGVFDYSMQPDFYKDAEKIGILYIWQLSINHVVIYGRTLQELDQCLQQIRQRILGRVIIYIHNLAYEFQFLRNIINDLEVFARKPRHPIKAYSPGLNIEFRCSLMLTNMSLEKLPKAMGLSIEKQTGLLDYNKLHLPCTDLTPDELRYCEYDCLVLWQVMNRYKADYDHVYNIPLTQTGRLRRVIKAMYKTNNAYYRKLVKILPVTYPEFNLLCKAYSGGYTHANALHSRNILKNVYSRDIASSYPTVMICEKFPMSRFTPVKLNRFEDMDPRYSYIVDVTFRDLRASVSYTYLSKSKAIEVYNAYEDNGRIVTAQRIRYILTEVDLSIVAQSYRYEYVINAAYVAYSERLDTNFVRYIIKLYKDKTMYKGLPEKSDLYARSKEYINSMYGMCVTNVIRDEVTFSGDWGILPMTVEDAELKLVSLTKRRKTFLSYAWGVYVTAYARRNLWQVILKMPDDVVYTDTDSIKYINADNEKYFDQYNADIQTKLKAAAAYHGVPLDDLMPEDPKGNRHIIGVYEIEGMYDKFVTLGAKKYCAEHDGKLEITISGVSKTKGLKAIHSISDFREGLIFDYYQSGRLVMTYNDNQPEIELTDYQGHKMRVNQPYGINAMPTTYALDIAVNYDEYLTRLSGSSSTHLSLLED